MKKSKIKKLIKEQFLKNLIDTKQDEHWIVGENYIIRTVTMIQIGTLKKVTDKELVLENSAWIPDTGRFSEALISGDFSEVEMFIKKYPIFVGRGALVDAQQTDIDVKSLKTK